MSLNRRDFIKMTGCCAGAAATMSVPGVSFAGPINDKKIIVIHCDGGLDGWGLMTPVYGDPDYRTYRAQFAVPGPNDMAAPANRRAYYMSDLFGLHPRMPELYGMFQRGEATFHMNVSMTRAGWNTGSHFHEMRRPRNGLDRIDDASMTGWLNRLLTVMEGENSPGAIGVTGTPVLPDTLRGPEPSAIYMPPGITSSEATLARLRETYAGNSLLSTFNQAMDRRERLSAALAGAHISMSSYSAFWGVTTQAQVAATILGSDPLTAPSVAVMQVNGWDFHGMELDGWGYPSSRLAHLSQALGVLVDTLKSYNIFDKTLIVLASEFGRPVQHNGVGTDHGHGQTGVIITGNPQLMALPGQGVVLNGAWPGLASKNQWNQIVDNGSFMNIVREYVAAHFGMSAEEKDFVIPRVGGVA